MSGESNNWTKYCIALFLIHCMISLIHRSWAYALPRTCEPTSTLKKPSGTDSWLLLRCSDQLPHHTPASATLHTTTTTTTTSRTMLAYPTTSPWHSTCHRRSTLTDGVMRNTPPWHLHHHTVTHHKKKYNAIAPQCPNEMRSTVLP